MHDIETILKTRIQNDEAANFVVVVPNDAARLKRQRELISYHPNRAVANLLVYDIENFVQRLYNQVRPSRQHISSGLQSLWIQEIADPDSADTYRYNAFRPIENSDVPDSTLSLITDTINHLRDQGETEPSFVTDNNTTTDLAHIYNEYEAKLQNRWVDEKGKHLYLANNFQDKFFKHTFPSADMVVVEGFTVLSKADIKLLKRIAEMSDIEMWFRTDCVEENGDLYKNIIELVSHFRDVGAHIDSDHERGPNRHQHFAENLFRSNAASDHKSDLTDEITFLRPADRSDEVEQIAHLIQQRVSTGKCNLGDICVAYYNFGQYQQRIAETFSSFDIPYSLSESIPLTKSEVVKAIFSRLSSNREPIGDSYFSDVEPTSHTRTFQPNEFQDYVDNLLNTGEVLQRILNSMLGKNQEIVEGEINAYHQFIRIVKEFCDVLKSEGDELHQLNYYIKKLHYIAKHTHYQNSALTKGEVVKIATLGELSSLEFNTVFLGDFVDGGFPQNYRPDPLLPETPYRTEDEQLHDNRFLFYRVLKSFRKQLYLLAPEREGVSELIPSLFLTQLKAIADITTTEVTDSSLGSIPGFLSVYGNHVWTTENPSEEEFPAEIAGMRPLIKHAVEVEKSREQTDNHSPYEGFLVKDELTPEGRSDLEKLRDKPYSVTELETYAKCPFQYFVSKVLMPKVKEDEDEDEPSSPEKGSLIHEVLYEFYKNRRDNEDPPITQCCDDTFTKAKNQLDGILVTKSEEKRDKRSEIDENNLFWKIEIEKLRAALHKWIEAERAYDLPVMPRYFEVCFGRSPGQRDPELSCPDQIPIGNVQMEGKIDRIDIGEGYFNVVDYKTGSTLPKKQNILEGRALQIPIYLQIAKKLLDENGKTGLELTAGLFHKIRLAECEVELGIGRKDLNGIRYKKYNGSEWGKCGATSRQLLDEEVFYEILTRVSGYVDQYVESISEGTFPLITRVDTFVNSEEEGDTPVVPKDKTEPCNYCAYKRSCRVGAFAEVSQFGE